MDTSARHVGLTLALGGLLVVLDTTVTLVAIPSIVTGFGSRLTTVQWTTTGYLLGVVAVIPLAGWAANTFGDRRVYLTALATFTVCSALAGLAWDIGSLIGFRALQGIGGGLLNPVGMGIGLRAVPRSVRGQMMSLLGLPVVIAPVLGLPLAGFLIDLASWRWIFAINVPVGCLAIALGLRILPAPTPRTQAQLRQPVDWLGVAQLSSGGAILVLGCTLLGQAGRLTTATLVTIAVGVGLLVVFTCRALGKANPLVELRLLAQRPLTTGAGVLVCFGAAYFGSVTILPIYVQAVRGDPAALAGTMTIPMGLAGGMVLQVATRLVDRVPPGRIVLAGTAVALLGCLALLGTTTAGAPYPWIAAAAAVLGMGAGATILPTMTVALRDLEGADTARGTTLLALLQQLSSALGVAVVATALTVIVGVEVPELHGGGIAAMLALSVQARATLGAHLASAVGHTYLVAAVLLALSAVIAMTGLPRRRTHQPDRTAHHERG